MTSTPQAADLVLMEVPAEEESWSKTTIKTLKGRHVWLINDFKDMTDIKGLTLESSPFVVRGHNHCFEFKVRLLPTGDPYQEYVALQLVSFNQVDCKERGVVIEASFTAKLAKENDELFKQLRTSNVSLSIDDFHCSSKKFSPATYGEVMSFPNAFKRTKILGEGNYLFGGQLTLVAHLRITVPETCSYLNHHQLKASSMRSHRNLLGLDICKLVGEDGKDANDLTDFTLLCGGQQFPCFRVLLAARSSVFRAMFSHASVKENVDRVVEISDVDADTMQKVLQFVYTDTISGLLGNDNGDGLIKLYRAADKYDLPELKSLCEARLVASLAVDNSATYLTLAHLHESRVLKEKAMNFIIAHMSLVSATDSWKSNIVKEHPEIMQEIIMKMCCLDSIRANQRSEKKQTPEESLK